MRSHESEAGPVMLDGPVTHAEASASTHQLWRRLLILYVLLFALSSAGAYALYHEEQNTKTAVYTQCRARVKSVDSTNGFYRKMTALEAANRFIDQKLRDERVALYRGRVLPRPQCGGKP